MTLPDPTHSSVVRDRARGALLGLAIGDALGTTLEFSRRDTLPYHTEMTGGGPFDLQPGQWTDDTSMALALAESLLQAGPFDPHDLATRFVAWWKQGAYSCTGACFDIGLTTRDALARFVETGRAETGRAESGSTDPDTAGNGSLMRLAPVALATLHDPREAERIAEAQSRTTHGAPEAVEACTYVVQLLRQAILGEADVLRPRAASCADSTAVEAIARGSWRGKTRAGIRSSGYVIHTLEAAFWAVGSTETFEDALILAVNLGDDADTVGAVTGQLAGARYGASAIPERWLRPLAWRERIVDLADALVAKA